jgi:PAS domain S-box-containing protein
LANSRAMLEAAIECLPFDFFAIGPDGRYILQNATTREHYGNLLGKRPEDCAPDEHSRQIWSANNQRAWAGERVEGEVEARIGDETRRFYNVVAPIRAGSAIHGILGVNVDITERKRAEEALRKAHGQLEQRVAERTGALRQAYEHLQREVEERRRAEVTLAAFFGDSPAILNILDYQFCYLRTDSLTPTYFGLDSKSIVGRSLEELCPEFFERYEAMLRRVLETGEPVCNVEVESPVASRPGDTTYWLASYFPVAPAEGRRGIGVVGVEITAMKQAQTALRMDRRTIKHMLHASDHERQMIAYDLHDGVAQQLAGAIMHLQSYAHSRHNNPENAAKAFEDGMAMLRQSHSETRRLISGVRPPVLDESGVVAAIAHLVYDPAFRDGPRIEFRSQIISSRLPSVLENAIYRIVQEGLTNIRKHSQSPTARVSLTQWENTLFIRIRDQGVGFDPENVEHRCFGLEGIRERARLLGGKCNIRSKPGRGTVVVVTVPVIAPEEEL